MELKKDFLDKIDSCAWFENCGDGSFDRFEVVVVKDKEKAIKNITSTKWENVYMEQQGNLTEYLFINHRDLYSESWNREIQHIKQEYLGKLLDLFVPVLENKGLTGKKIVDNVRYNIMLLFMASFYSEYYSSEFFEQMLEIYLSGHLPCGWSGSKKSGKFMVY